MHDQILLWSSQEEEKVYPKFLNITKMRDKLVWLKSKSGEYTTKTGYALAKINTDSDPEDHFDWKKRIWQVNTSPKLKHHMWKASVNALPVGTNLRRRGIEVDSNCTRCGAVEIDIHVLLHCPICHKSLE